MDDFNFEQFLISIGATLLVELNNPEYYFKQKFYKLPIGKGLEKLYFHFSFEEGEEEPNEEDFVIFKDPIGNEIESIIAPGLKTGELELGELDNYSWYLGSVPTNLLFAKELIIHLG